MIPTPDAQTRRDPERSSRTQILNLGRSEVDEGRQQQEIRSLRLEVPPNRRVLGAGPLHGAQDVRKQSARPCTEGARDGADAHEGSGCPLARTLAELPCVVEDRVLISKVIETQSETLDDP